MTNPIPVPTTPATVIDVLVRDSNNRVTDRERYARLDPDAPKPRGSRGSEWMSFLDGQVWDTSHLDLDHNTFEVVAVPVSSLVTT